MPNHEAQSQSKNKQPRGWRELRACMARLLAIDSMLSSGSRASVFVWAAVLFFVLNASLAASHAGTGAASLSPEMSWSWWTVRDLSTVSGSPNVVLLGSSLMVAAVSECDATVAHRPLDLSSYRGASYLDGKLKDNLGSNFETLNLSAPGQMPSDAFLTLKAALAHKIRPATIIYGVAPRDFFDGTLASPSDTEAFRYLSQLVDLEGSDLDFFSTPAGKLGWILKRSIYASEHAALWRSAFSQALARWLPGDLGKSDRAGLPAEDRLAIERLQRSIAVQARPQAVWPGCLVANWAENGGPSKRRLEEDLRDYRSRYRNPDPGAYHRQFRFMKRLSALCKRNDIALLIVNMPVTKLNISLLKPGLYERYRQDLAQFASQYGAHFIDLGNSEKEGFRLADYRDTVHLNGLGGKKFIEQLCAAAACDLTIRTAIDTAAKRREVKSVAASGTVEPL